MGLRSERMKESREHMRTAEVRTAANVTGGMHDVSTVATRAPASAVPNPSTQPRPTLTRVVFTPRELALVAMFAAVTSVLAYVRIPLPFGPVPITGQTLGLMLAGLVLGPRLAAISQAVYILMGLVGLPVFAGGTAGIGVLVGPTGGYLWAHIPGAYMVGLIAGERSHLSVTRALTAAAVGGIVAVYGLGVWQLAAVAGMDWQAAIAAGVLPFLVGDAIKVAAAAVVGRRLAAVGMRNAPRWPGSAAE